MYSTLIIGSGNRIKTNYLPALSCVKEHFEITGVHSRTERLIIQTTAAGEYAALNRGNTTAKFIRDVLQFYGNTTNIYHLYTDNQAAEHIATQPATRTSPRPKHGKPPWTATMRRGRRSPE